jgi:hypothetical protein
MRTQVKRRRRSCSAVPAVVVSLVVLAGCASSNTQTVTQDTAGALPTGVADAILPAGYSAPWGLATDNEAAGVWGFATSLADTRLFHWAPEGTKSWLLAEGAESKAPSGRAGLAVDADGRVVVGIDMSLFVFDPSSETVDRVAVPLVEPNEAEQAYRPPALQSGQWIQDVAAGPNGEIALALSGGSAVLLYELRTREFTVLRLPADSTAAAVEFTDSGELGIGLVNFRTHMPHTFGLVRPGGELQLVRVPDSASVLSTGEDFIVGLHRLSRVDLKGEVRGTADSRLFAMKRGGV